MKLKKVLFISSIYYPNIGGVENVIDDLSQIYIKKGIKSAVLTKKYPLNLKENEKINGINVVRIKRPVSINDYIGIFKIIKKNENKLKPDIIHVIGVRRPMTLIALILSKIWHVPLLINFSGGDIYEKNDPEAVVMWKEGKEIITNSVYQSNGLASFSNGISRNAFKLMPKINQINLIYAGIDYERIKKIKKLDMPHSYFVSVRRLYFSKGIDILIRSFGKISKKYPNINLEVIGEGPELNNLIELCKTLKIDNRVKFWGTQTLDISISLMKGSIASICPSRAEGGGLVNIEAQAAGTFAIGSDAGGIPEYIDENVTGLLFKNGSVNELAKKMEIAIVKHDLREKIIKNAIYKSELFDWKNIANQYLDFYINLIDNYNEVELNPWSEDILEIYNNTKKIWNIN